jgi:hypothetical protein
MVAAEHLMPYVHILRRSFPNGVSEAERGALMAAIYDEFSERNLSEVLEEFLGGDRHQLLAEAIRARSERVGGRGVEETRRTLSEHGWDFDS